MYIIQKNIMPYFIRDQYPTHSYSERYNISLPYQRKLARLFFYLYKKLIMNIKNEMRRRQGPNVRSYMVTFFMRNDIAA